jgi:hypothetical protein
MSMRVWFGVAGLVGMVGLGGCLMEEEVGVAEGEIGGCAAPVSGGAVCQSGAGELTFQVTLPSGQQYVELFVRQNGIQNVATAIQGSGVDHGDGTATYALTRGGYAPSDRVEYRFYSYRPASPGVFTPGAAEQRWYGFATVPVSRDAAVIYASVGTGPAANKNFGSAPTVDIGEYHLTSEGLFAYGLTGVVPTGASVTRAELVIDGAYAPGGPTVALRLNQITSAWSESTVTWNSKPSYALLGEVVITPGVENRLDVTGAVAAASGEIGFALQPSPASSSTDNVFIDAREKVGGAPTSLRISWR